MKSIALISEHASPLADLGGVDSGGQNVYVAQVAAFLAARGYDVDVFTRRDDPDLPEISECAGRLPGDSGCGGPAEVHQERRAHPVYGRIHRQHDEVLLKKNLQHHPCELLDVGPGCRQYKTAAAHTLCDNLSRARPHPQNLPEPG